MAFELLLVLCTIENSAKCNEISFDPDPFLRIAKRSIRRTLVRGYKRLMYRNDNRPFSYSEKESKSNDIFCYIL